MEANTHRKRYEKAMAAGAAEYADVILTLNEAGLPTQFTQTGGMNAALVVQLETGQTLLVTDADDTLAWRRAELSGWSVGLYEPGAVGEDGPIRFGSVADRSINALTALIADLLGVAPPGNRH